MTYLLKHILVIFLLIFYIPSVSGLELITTGADDLTYSDYWQYMTFNKFTPTTDGTLMNISVKVVDTTSGAAIKVAVYNDSAGVPYKPINSTIINTTIAGWFVVDLIVPMTAGSQYWIAYESQNNTVSARFQTTVSGFSRQQTLNWYSAFPSPAASAVDTVTLYSQSYINEYPSVPVVTTPANNSVDYDVTTLNMSWTTSTDTEGDEINYHYQIGNDSVFSDIAYEGNTSVNFSGSKTISATQLFFRVHANDSHGSSSWSPVVSIRDITLSSPVNNSIHYFNYPPMITEFNFLWSVTESSVVHYNLLIASDNNFNLIKSDTTFDGTTKTISLDEGTYWYRIRPYYTETETYGSYTNAWTFILVGNVSVPSGTGIQGIVYELVDGVITPISEARVYIYNNLSTWSSEMVTGSNGYYLFTGLTNNTTYYIRATKSSQYTDSVPYYVTTGSGTTSTQDILLEKCQSGDTCFYGQVTPRIYFIYQNATNTTFMSGYPVRIFMGDDILPLYTLTTDSDGMVSPRLAVGTRYRFEIYAIGTSSPTLITNLLDSYKTATSDDIVFYIGSLNGTIPLPGAPDTNATNFTNRSTGGGLAAITNATLTSDTGIGVLGQGVLVSFITWIVAGAGGPLTVLFTCSILAYMGILTWTTMFLFVITSASIYILKEM